MTLPSDARALLDAGTRLAPLLAVPDAARLCEAANLPPDSLEREFGGLPRYLRELQNGFMLKLRERVMEKTLGRGPLAVRVYSATETYLDDCLAHHAVRRWFVHARRHDADIADDLRRQNHAWIMLLTANFQETRWPFPDAAARLYMAMLMHVANAEHAAKKPDEEMRSTLRAFLEAL